MYLDCIGNEIVQRKHVTAHEKTFPGLRENVTDSRFQHDSDDMNNVAEVDVCVRNQFEGPIASFTK